MNDTEQEVLEGLRTARTEEEILNTVNLLTGSPETPESYALIGAAGEMLAERLDN